LESLATLVNIGTLFAFALVSIGVLVLRRTNPDLRRAFRIPTLPLTFIAPLAVLACLWLMLNLPLETWGRFVAWMVLGLVVYFLYGARKSRLARNEGDEEPTT
jgi:APA family basic amino acid/polyamine antiporter